MNEIEPSWDCYRTFLTVLRAGSLSAAARELGLTQPTVGRHIDALEQSIGFELFLRSPQGLIATDGAIALRPYAETLASAAAALQRTASGHRDGVEGTVRISASDVIGVEVLPPILARLQEAYPRLTFELSLSDAVEDLLRHDADIAVRMVEPAQAALVVRRIGTLALGLYAHRRYLDRNGTPETIAELIDHRMIGYDRRTAFIRAAETMIRACVKDFPEAGALRYAVRADSNLAQLAAIRAGAGIGICQVALGARDPELVRLLPDDFELPLTTWVAVHENLKSSPRCRVTFDALVEGLRDYAANA